MSLQAPRQRITYRLAIALVAAAGLAACGCERRPGDPKPPSDPGRNVPKPITAVAAAAWSAPISPGPGR